MELVTSRNDKTMGGCTSSLPILMAAVPASSVLFLDPEFRYSRRVAQDSGDAFSIGNHESGKKQKRCHLHLHDPSRYLHLNPALDSAPPT